MTLLSRGPETGYSIIQKIDERTEGAWRPGPGTMYPLLRSLVQEGISSVKEGPKLAEKTYRITPKGRRSLEEMRRHFSEMGRREPVMARLFSDLVPDQAYVTMVVRRQRDGAVVLRGKMAGVKEPERTAYLKELKLHTEAQLDWINAELAAGRPRSPRPPRDSGP